jgi:hypothetical protein
LDSYNTRIAEITQLRWQIEAILNYFLI